MKINIKNIVVDLKGGQRISIKADSRILDFCAQCMAIETVCALNPGYPDYQVAALALVQAAEYIDQNGTLDEAMLPTFAACVDQIHQHLLESYQSDYSGGIYIHQIAHDDGYADIEINDFYFMALNGELDHREPQNFTVSISVRIPSDEQIH